MFSLISEINANAYCTEIKVGARFKTQKEGRSKHMMLSWSHGGSLAGNLRVDIMIHTFDGKGSMEDGGVSYHICLAAACAAVDDIFIQWVPDARKYITKWEAFQMCFCLAAFSHSSTLRDHLLRTSGFAASRVRSDDRCSRAFGAR